MEGDRPAFLIGDCDDLSQVKIIDFGLACRSNAVTSITDFLKCGTFLYKPPEQISNVFSYAKKADIWAAGEVDDSRSGKGAKGGVVG